MMKTITVKAAPGLRVPYETDYRKTIGEKAQETVPTSAYYLRRIADGDLIRVEKAKGEK